MNLLNNKLIDNLCESLHNLNIDLIFISPSENLKHFTGIDVLNAWKFQGLFITEKRNLFYISPRINQSIIKPLIFEGVEIFFYDNCSMEAIKKAFTKYNVYNKSLAVNEQCKAIDIIDIIDDYNIRLFNGKEIIEEITVIKSNYELEMLAVASAKIDVVYEMLLNYIKPGMSEYHLKEKMHMFFKELGIYDCYEGSICFGKSTSIPYYNGYSNVLKKNDIILIDLACKYRGVFSKITRTFFMGKPTEYQLKAYNTIYEIVKHIEEHTMVGMQIKQLDLLAGKILKKNCFEEMLIHEIGHGIGHCEYEAPYIDRNNTDIIKNGMSFVINPGLYFENDFGIRIEDIITVQNDQLIPLNMASKEIIIL